MAKLTGPKTPEPLKRKRTARAAEIDSLLKDINKVLGNGRTVIARGSQISWASAKRWSTGSLGLDVALNGGVPMGMIIQFTGEESSGKTTMAFKTAAQIQRKLGNDAAIAWVSVEGFDKKWANENGCVVPFTPKELRVMSPEDRERFKDTDELGTFVVASAVTGEDALEVALRFIRSGKFHLVIVDSMAALVPASEEEREMAENTMGKSPAMIGKFLRKCGTALNARDTDNEPNETAIILINQVRDVIGGYGHPAPQPPGGRALRHWPVATVRFTKGELLKEGDKDTKFVYAKRTKVRVEKSKIGPPYREAEFDFYFAPYGDFRPGDIDIAQETRIWGVRSGIIKQTSNTSYAYGGKTFVGKAKLDAWLRTHPDMMDTIHQQVLAAMTTSGSSENDD